MLYMVTFTINIPQMLAYIPAPWILWDITGYGYPIVFFLTPYNHQRDRMEVLSSTVQRKGIKATNPTLVPKTSLGPARG